MNLPHLSKLSSLTRTISIESSSISIPFIPVFKHRSNKLVHRPEHATSPLLLVYTSVTIKPYKPIPFLRSFSLSPLPRPRLPSISRPFEILAIHRILASSSKSKTVRSFEIHRRRGGERKRNGKREMGTRIRFGARFMRRTVGNNRSGNSAGIVSAGAVHSTPQTLSFEPLARSCSSSSLSLLSTPYPQCHPVVVVVVVVVLLDTRQMTISPG